MKNQKLAVIIIALVLLISPLFWFPNEAFDACGDDHKLWLYAPENYLSNFSVYTWSSSNALSIENLPYPNYLFMIIPFAFAKMGLSPGQIEKIFYGIILFLGFLFSFLLIKEMLKRLDAEETAKFFGSAIGALIFIFSPLVLYTEWLMRLNTVFLIFFYPCLMYFFVLAVNNKNAIYLMPGVFISGVFSFLVYTPVPWTCSFLLISSVFFITWTVLFSMERKRLVKYLLLYGSFIIILNSSWIIVLAHSFISSKNIPMLSSGAIPVNFIKASAEFSKAMASYFDSLYAFLMLPSQAFAKLYSVFKNYSFYNKLYFFLPLPLLIGAAMLRANKKNGRIILLPLVPALIAVYFITVNITDIGVNLFSLGVEKIPGFIMFRNFYGKFPISFSLFYSIAIGISFAAVFSVIKSAAHKRCMIISMCVLIFAMSMPLLSGKIIGVSGMAGIYERCCPEIPRNHFDALDVIRRDKTNSRVFIFPVSFAQYMCFRSANGECYTALPYIKAFTGHDEFGGIWGFTTLSGDFLPKVVSGLINNYEYPELYRILWMLNVKYAYWYKEIAPENAQMFLFKYGLIDKMKTEFLKNLTYNSMKNFDDIELYNIVYAISPLHITAKTYIMKTDDTEWLSKLVYSDYMAIENSPMITQP